MKVLVTGVNGQLGYDVIRELKKRGVACLGADKDDFDIVDFDSTNKFITEYNPDAVIHCAAYTAVDQAEIDRDSCYAVNVTGTQNIANSCRKIGSTLIFISSDYVFPGVGEQFYKTTDETGPLNYYGQTKVIAENVIRKILNNYFIIRTSWAFGINGTNFVKTILRLAMENSQLNVIADQIGSPTYTVDLSQLICNMLETDKYGIYHATNEGVCSWAEFASEIIKLTDLSTKINFVSSNQYKTIAKRPLNSRLSKNSLTKNGFKHLPDWHDALRRYMKELKIKYEYKL